jgi:hypothetical protein
MKAQKRDRKFTSQNFHHMWPPLLDEIEVDGLYKDFLCQYLFWEMGTWEQIVAEVVNYEDE